MRSLRCGSGAWSDEERAVIWIVGSLLLALGIGLAVWAWPQLMTDLQERNVQPARDEFGRPERPVTLQNIDAVGPQTDERCAPAPWGEDQLALRAAFMDFLDAVDAAKTDDPGAWPDASRGQDALALARGRLDHAEAVVELASLGGVGGPAADGPCREALAHLRTARGQGAPADEVCAEFGRAIWIRSRERQHRYWRDGAMEAAKWANDALTALPRSTAGRVMAARAQVALGHLDVARHALIKLMGEHPDEPQILRSRSRWLRAHGDRRGAADSVLPLLDKLPDTLAVAERIRIGPMLVRERQFVDGRELYTALVERDPDEATFQVGLARCALETKKLDVADVAARKAVQQGAGQVARDLLREVLMRSGKTMDS